VTGSSPAENAMYGDNESHALRYERTREFMTILRQLWDGPSPSSYKSDLYQFENAVLEPKPQNRIPLYFGGASEAAQRIAAELADVYLLWGEKREMVLERLEKMKVLEREYGRTLRYGLRCHVVVRETESEAVLAAERLISRVDPQVRAAFETSYQNVDSAGQQRQIEMLQTALEHGDFWVEPHLWAGVGMARSGVGVALVGSPQQIAAKLEDYRAMGIDTFILSGYPHLEECRRFGELVMPLLTGKVGEARAIFTDTVAPVS